MKTLRLVLASLVWVPALLLVELPAILLAFVVVPVMVLLGRIKPGLGYQGRPVVDFDPDWINDIWGNYEDGVAGPTEVTENTSPSLRRWIERMDSKPSWYRILSWSIWRNPASNLRWSRWWGVLLSRADMEWLGNSMNPWKSYKEYLGIPSYARRYQEDRFWCWARQGAKSGLWIIWAKPGRRFAILRIGWKVYPGYERPIDRHVGFSIQAGWNRKADFEEGS